MIGMSGPANASAAASRSTGRQGALALLPPLLWAALVVLAPLCLVIRLSLSRAAQAQPPYRPVVESLGQWRDFLAALTFDNFALIASDDLYAAAILSSLRIAATATLIALLVAYPLAHAIAAARKRLQAMLIVLVMLPFWTSFLIRIYAWLVILKPEGLLNAALLGLGVISEPLDLLNREEAVILGIVYSYLPFMVLPIYAALQRIDMRLLEAASDLGAPGWKVFLAITLPLSLPGVIAGSLLVFIPAIGEFVVPDLLGGPDTLMIGHVLWVEFFSNRDWPLASALALVLLGLAAAAMIAIAPIRRRLRA